VKRNSCRPTKVGRVIKLSDEKTVVVLVSTRKAHPKYKKVRVLSKKYLVHSENTVKVGETVEISSCRPISKRKNWRLSSVVTKVS